MTSGRRTEHDLNGRRVAIVVAPKGTEHVELAQPRHAVEQAGAEVTLVGIEPGRAHTVRDDLEPAEQLVVDAAASEVSADDFDALIVPGGTVGADRLRGDDDAVRFVRGFFEQGKPVAAICHGPWALVEADVVRGRRLTSYTTLETDIRNAGGSWVDEEVVTDQGLTSRRPDDLEAFCAKLVEELAEGRHQVQVGRS